MPRSRLGPLGPKFFNNASASTSFRLTAFVLTHTGAAADDGSPTLDDQGNPIFADHSHDSHGHHADPCNSPWGTLLSNGACPLDGKLVCEWGGVLVCVCGGQGLVCSAWACQGLDLPPPHCA